MYYIKTDGEYNNIKVQVLYSKGGFNWFDGSNIDRGFYLSLTPVKREMHDYNGRPYFTEQTRLGAGYKITTKAIAKKSQKAFREAIEELKAKPILIKQCLYKILEEFDLLLENSNDYNITWDEFDYEEC